MAATAGEPAYAPPPVIRQGETLRTITDTVADAVLVRAAGRAWWIAFGVSSVFVLLLIVALVALLTAGIGIWGIDWPVVWGFAIVNYVWWIAIASGGTLVSAIFYLTGSEWRTAITRLAETMTLCGIACAGIYPIIHLGRPYYFYWLFPYANTMGLWPQFRSPLLWDFFAILTYVIASVLFWYFGLVPDLATMRDRAEHPAGRIIYGVLALGWRGSAGQWRHYKAAYGVLAGLMTPLVISVHSIVGLDFAAGLSPGWHSTQFPPFFVFGALLSGIATVLVLIVAVRALYGLQAFITGRHLDALAKVMLVSSIAIGYAYLMEVFSTFYGLRAAERTLAIYRMFGPYAAAYWATILCNVALPQLLWCRRLRGSAPALVAIALAVIVGMWFERYVIVVISLNRPILPSAWGSFVPTFWDIATLLGTIGFFVWTILLLLRLIPAISMSELRVLVDRMKGEAG
jgi:Ni/Fe-hydrogenase subunit HybB-like protein